MNKLTFANILQAYDDGLLTKNELFGYLISMSPQDIQNSLALISLDLKISLEEWLVEFSSSEIITSAGTKWIT